MSCKYCKDCACQKDKKTKKEVVIKTINELRELLKKITDEEEPKDDVKGKWSVM